MSADNGIYILTTPKGKDYEFRVAHLQAVDNYKWHYCSKHGSDPHFGNDGRPNCEECHTGRCSHTDCHIKNAREMWQNCKVFAKENEAIKEADRQYEEIMEDAYCPIVEYGISEIFINEEF